MNKLLKAVLISAAAAGAALVGWRLVRPPAPRSSEEHTPSTNGDFEAGGHGTAEELTDEQREKLLEELEDQLGA